MKKNLIIFSLILVLCACLFSGCSNTINEGKETHEIRILNLSSQMIWLEKFDNKSGLCYDKDTKIIYMYSSNPTYTYPNTVSYSPYYVMDTNNNPTIGIYNGDN